VASDPTPPGRAPWAPAAAPVVVTSASSGARTPRGETITVAGGLADQPARDAAEQHRPHRAVPA